MNYMSDLVTAASDSLSSSVTPSNNHIFCWPALTARYALIANVVRPSSVRRPFRKRKHGYRQAFYCSGDTLYLFVAFNALTLLVVR